MVSIGELSRATALTVKALRHYHERGLLMPARVDPRTGYRFYDGAAFERARAIKALRALDFSLDDIGAILADCGDDADTLAFLEAHRAEIAARLSHLRAVSRALDSVIQQEKEARAMNDHAFQIEEKTLPTQLIAGIRTHGHFAQCGDVFKRLGRALGFGIGGKASMLVYDEEYKEGDADFEPFFPVKRRKRVPEDVRLRELAGGRALCLVHRGPYDRIAEVYGRLFLEIRERGLRPLTPSREVYLKGPGMIFEGNPARYLTEVQVLVE